uniref:Syntaxin-binding protein 3-like n=1 Tax=Sinocyclocheilus anshuiensis TaxID=1608454 RepID=A0A671RJY8_9TELE
MAAGAEHGLKRIVWQRIKDTLIADCRKSEVWKILILDQFTTRLLSSCCKMSNLMSEGITIVEDLHKNREPVPEMKAIYFMRPTAMCVDAFINDFKPKPKYKAAYVFFTDYCPDDLFDKMKKNCAKHIKVCKEINISFLPLEAQVFTCENTEAFKSIYTPNSQDKDQTLETIANQIVTLCSTLDEYPGVRYKKDSALDYGNKLAELVDNKLARHYELDDHSKKKGKTQAQLLIVDRALDPVSPILHELTFQAMAYDLIPIKDNNYEYKLKDGSKKEALLNEEDELWVKLRHMHIAEVTGFLLIGLLVSFKKYTTVQKFGVSSAHKGCMYLIKNTDLAVGADAEGQKVKDPMRTLLPVLLHPHDTTDKIRAVLLYIFSLNGTTAENLNKLIQHVKIEDESGYILNWKHLGVPILSTPSMFSFRKQPRKDRSDKETYNVSRWTPVIKDIMEDAVENKLEVKDWPYQSECPSVWNGSRAVSARQKHKGSSPDDLRSGSRLILFVLGGVSYSEMRCAYEVTHANKSCEVIIGSTHILTPRGLLEDIYNLDK